MSNERELTSLFVDLDNTLYDYNAASREARGILAKEISVACGVPAPKILDVYELVIVSETGASAPSGQALRQRRLTELAERLGVTLPIAHFVRRLGEALVDAAEPYPGALSALHDLRRDHRVIIVSEGYHDVQTAMTAKLGLQSPEWDLFARLADGVRKRDGSAFRMALQHYGLQPEQTAVVGDNWNWDILSGAGVGLWQIWISHGLAVPGPTPSMFIGTVPELAAVPALIRDRDVR